MRENSSISEYRGRLDKTLSSHDLTNVETLRTLVKDQIVKSSSIETKGYIDKIVENRTKEVSNFLGMLRSASINDVERSHSGWKVKQDTEEFRVMYREGPEGTPFHSLLVEGYVDGPLDVCLCISCEAGLYQKWWPQTAIPTFKITSSQCLKKIGTGEQICLVRMKLSWPMSAREALVHYFEFEYFQDDLIVVLLNSIPDSENIDRSTHGFSRDGIPDAQDVVRIDVVGGFALQKVSATRSYFRTIANMDIKLDFVPPAFINFISRQLIGSGFKLYKKEVASVSRGEEDFSKALNDPMYAHIREAIYSDNLSETAPEPEDVKNETYIVLQEQLAGEHEVRTTVEIVHNENLAISSHTDDYSPQCKVPLSEIEEIKEEKDEESESLEEDAHKSCNMSANQIAKRVCTDNRKDIFIRPEVEEALRTLEKAISFIQEHGSNDKTSSLPAIAAEESQNSEYDVAKESVSSETNQSCRKSGASAQLLKKEDPEIITAYEPRNSSGSHGSSRRQGYSRDTNHNKIAPASPDEDTPSLFETQCTTFHSSQNQAPALTVAEKITKEDNLASADTNGVGENSPGKTKSRKFRFCCLRSFAWQLPT